ncbi:hypothetical protein L7F22_026211 [Adiantum nelumboides]|nr:hypothetical protein [Adiantum nelumboides]
MSSEEDEDIEEDQDDKEADDMQTLLLAMFVRGRDIGLVQWRYNRTAGQEAASDDGFGERVDMLWEPFASDAIKPWRTNHNGKPLRLGVKKSTQFARQLACTCLAPLQRVPNDLPFTLFFGEVFKALQHQRAMTQEREFYDASSSQVHMRPPSVRPPMSTMSPTGSTISSCFSFGAPYFRPSLPIPQPMPYPYIPY